jgi:GntR family transcriptional regulator/MocR family aminotransferase
MDLPLTIDRSAATTLDAQVCTALRLAIRSGGLRPGVRLPSTRALSQRLGVARATVALAYDQLAAEGYIEGRRGAGTFVCQAVAAAPAATTSGVRPSAPARPIRLSRFAERLGPLPRSTTPARGEIDVSAPGTDDTLFPFDVWHRLVRRHLRRSSSRASSLRDAAGHEGLRTAIAAYVGRARAVPCRPDQVIVVHGSQHALDLCARVLVDAGDGVAVEDPGYPDAGQILAAAGARVCPVPVDADGVVVSAIPARVRVAHVTPSHQYPTGVALSLARRLELLAWAEAVAGLVIEDDYDTEFRYDGSPLPAMYGLAGTGRVVYVGTFSTATFAGLRLGYLVLPEPLVEPFTRAKWYGSRHTPTLEQAVLADFIGDGHFERHLRRMRRAYRRRRDALREALAHHFGRAATVVGDAAGLHAVVRFVDPGMGARAARAGVVMRSTRACYRGRPRDGEFILRFGAVDERTIREGVARLARAGGRR